MPTGSTSEFLLSTILNRRLTLKSTSIPKSSSELILNWINSVIKPISQIDPKSKLWDRISILLSVVNSLLESINQCYSPNNTFPIISFFELKLGFLENQLSYSTKLAGIPGHKSIFTDTLIGEHASSSLSSLKFFIDPCRIQIMRGHRPSKTTVIALLSSNTPNNRSFKPPTKVLLSFSPPHPPNTDPFHPDFLSLLISLYHPNLALFLGVSIVHIDNEARKCHVYEYLDTQLSPSLLSEMSPNSKTTILLQMTNLLQYLFCLKLLNQFTLLMTPSNISLSYTFKISKVQRLFVPLHHTPPINLLFSYPSDPTGKEIHSSESNIVFSLGSLMYYFFSNCRLPFDITFEALDSSPSLNDPLLLQKVKNHFKMESMPGHIEFIDNRMIRQVVSLCWNYSPEFRIRLDDIHLILSSGLTETPSIDVPVPTSQITPQDPTWRASTLGIAPIAHISNSPTIPPVDQNEPLESELENSSVPVFDSGITSDHSPEDILSQIQSLYKTRKFDSIIQKIDHLLEFFSKFFFVRIYSIFLAKHKFESNICCSISWKHQIDIGIQNNEPIPILYAAIVQAQHKSHLSSLLHPLSSDFQFLDKYTFFYQDKTTTSPETETISEPPLEIISHDSEKLSSLDEEMSLEDDATVATSSTDHTPQTISINIHPLFNDVLLPLIDKQNPDPLLMTIVGLLFFYQLVFSESNSPSSTDTLSSSQARQFFTLAAEEGEPVSQLYLGLIFRSDKDFPSCIEWMSKSAHQGSIIAQRTLAQLFESSKHMKDLHQSIQWYTRAANQNDLFSLLKLGKFSLKGNSAVIQSYSMAQEWFSKASEIPDVGRDEAYFQLATLYKNGKGVKKSLKRAAKYYLLGAELGHIASQYLVGHWYEKGYGFPQKNIAEALKWFSRAAEAKNPKALCRLGSAYKTGSLGLEVNLTLTLEYFLKAADLNFANAQYQLGHCYEMGVGVEQSITKAANYFQLGADNGSPDAFNALLKLETRSSSPATDSSDSNLALQDGIVTQDDVDNSLLHRGNPLPISGELQGNNGSRKSSSSKTRKQLTQKSSFLKRNRSKMKKKRNKSRSTSSASSQTAFLDLIS